MGKPEDLKVFIATSSPKCEECGEELGRKAWITLSREKGAQCLSCADLDHLVFLRHEETNYDHLLMTGHDRHVARTQVQPQIESTLEKWRGSGH